MGDQEDHQEAQDQVDHQELHHHHQVDPQDLLDQLDHQDLQDHQDHQDHQVPKDQEDLQELQLHHHHHVLQSVQHFVFQRVHNTVAQQERRSNFKYSVSGFSLFICNILRFIHWFGLIYSNRQKEKIYFYKISCKYLFSLP